MRLRVLPISIAAVGAVLAMGAGADSRPVADHVAKPVKRSPDLWATINKCDTPAYPNTIGVRGSMPGLGKRSATAYMRFRVQYRRASDGRWHDVTDDATSSWKRVGRLRKRALESGQDFTFQPPTGGGAHRLRGVVQFKWTRHGKAVLRLKRITRRGHKSAAGADPASYSAAVCDIR